MRISETHDIMVIMTQSQRCNHDHNYNDDNVMRASVCGLNSLVVYLNVEIHGIWEETWQQRVRLELQTYVP